MQLDPLEAKARLSASRVLRLATADRQGTPHLVPCTFVIDDSGRIATGIDNKPKTSLDLRRIRNIEQNPCVSLLADEYQDDWDRLWWARADGTAILERGAAEHEAHWRLLKAKYPQYDGQDLDGPVILVTVETWSGWAFSPGR